MEIFGADSISSIPTRIKSTAGALWVYIAENLGFRNRGTSNSFISTKEEWNYTPYNPRAASIGSSKGAAGTAGNVEILVGGGVPIRIGGIITEDDTVAGSILLRDVTATGSNASARSLSSVLNTVTNHLLNIEFLNGLTVCGTAAGVSCIIKWRPI